MRKGKTRTRNARVDLLKGMARSRARVRNLQKRSYPKRAYDGHGEGAGSQDQYQ